MTEVNPDDLRKRADAAEIAGDNNTADALRAEADELENRPPAEDAGTVP